MRGQQEHDLQGAQKKTVEIDKARYTDVGIDDFAIRRGHSYGTCMVDHKTHAVIDMIPTRDLEETDQWLRTWKNLELVTRDGSFTYRAAIRNAHPSCTQVADRFHLLKNVLDGADSTIRSMLPSKVRLCCSEAPAKNAETSTEAKPLTQSEYQRQERALEARKLHNAGMSYSQIGSYLGLDRKTVQKYCSECFSPRFDSGKKRPSKIDGFRDLIDQLMHVEKHVTAIFAILKEEGYKGSYETVQKYVKLQRKANPVMEASMKTVSTVDRSSLISLIYKPITRIPELTTEAFAEVLDFFPALWEVYQCIDSFRYALFHGTREQLSEWVTRTADSPFPRLASAAEGIRRDLDAAMNAVSYPHSNGVVEGSNTKIKLTKRVMYGRCHFSTLRTKILLKEQRRQRVA